MTKPEELRRLADVLSPSGTHSLAHCGDASTALREYAESLEREPAIKQRLTTEPPKMTEAEEWCQNCTHHAPGKLPGVHVYDSDCFECTHYYASKYESRAAAMAHEVKP